MPYPDTIRSPIIKMLFCFKTNSGKKIM